MHTAFLHSLIGIQAGKLQQTLTFDGVQHQGTDISVCMPTGLLSVLHYVNNVWLLHICSFNVPIAHHIEKHKLV